MFSALTALVRKWRSPCRACEAGGIHISRLHHFDNLREIARHKTVVEYQCGRCGTLWVHPDQTEYLSQVFKNELYAQWKQRSCMPTAKQIDILNRIGGVCAHDPREIFFPCEVQMQGGTRKQRALLTTTNGRCFGQLPKTRNIELLSEAHELFPSRYALPADVRAATMIAPEKKMGYAPIDVKDAGGNRYTLAGPMHFFDKNKVCGCDITLDDAPDHGGKAVFVGKIEMYLICDPFDGRTQGS